MGSRICAHCHEVILRNTPMLLCSQCNTVFHTHCCLNEWFTSVNSITCGNCIAKELKSEIATNNQFWGLATPTKSNTSDSRGGTKRFASPQSPSLLPSPRRHKSSPSLSADNTLEGSDFDTLGSPTLHSSTQSLPAILSMNDPKPVNMDDLTALLNKFQSENKADAAANIDTINKKIDNISVQAAALHAEIKQELHQIKLEQAKLRVDFDKHDIEIKKHSTQLAAIQAEIGNGNASVLGSLIDDCEILISNIPLSTSLTNQEVLRRVLALFGLESYVNFIISYREWKPNHRAVAMETDTEAAVSSVVSQTPTRAFVFKCLTSAVRDNIMLSSAKLRDVTADTLFEQGGGGKIYLRALWPAPIYEILKKAHDIAREKNLPWPFVRNLRVFMRKSKTTRPVCINSVNDLQEFQSLPKT